MTVSIGTLKLGNKPCVAAVVDTTYSPQELRGLRAEGVDLLELRFDLLGIPLQKAVEYVRTARETSGLPLIGTVRETPANRQTRMEWFREVIPYVDAIDIELGSPLSDAVLKVASGKTVIVSEHDFTRTPDRGKLDEITDRAVHQGAHIVKIATMARNHDDIKRLMQFTGDSKVPVVTIAMGPLGTISRVLAPLYGSLFTYGYIAGEVAPGQLQIRKLIEEIRLYYPG